MSYSNCPFNKNRPCRESNMEKGGCPAWLELLETNIATGEEKITKTCLFQYFPRLIVELVKASNRPAAVMESVRNEISKGFATLVAGQLQIGE